MRAIASALACLVRGHVPVRSWRIAGRAYSVSSYAPMDVVCDRCGRVAR